MSDDETRPTQAAWSDVDKAADTRAFTAYLDTIRTLNAIDTYKRQSIELMRLSPGGAALDIGCGTGDESKKLSDLVGPQGRVLGIDFSAAMVEESQRRWSAPGLSFQVGDVHQLDLPDKCMDAARADRVFQHLASPRQALAELARVVRPGGRVVLSDPDWGTYILDGTPTTAFRRYLDFAQNQAHNPWIGRQFYGLFRELGLVELELASHVAFFLDLGVLEKLGNLDAGFISAVSAGQLTQDEVDEVKAELRSRQDQGRFFGSVNVFTVAGTVR